MAERLNRRSTSSPEVMIWLCLRTGSEMDPSHCAIDFTTPVKVASPSDQRPVQTFT